MNLHAIMHGSVLNMIIILFDHLQTISIPGTVERNKLDASSLKPCALVASYFQLNKMAEQPLDGSVAQTITSK